MAVTRSDVVDRLLADEPDYREAARLGPGALVHLEALVHEADGMLASKAAYLASLIAGPSAARILGTAAEHAEPEVRVAAAAALANLDPARDSLADAGGVVGLLEQLLRDPEPGVRKFALRSAAAWGAEAKRGSIAEAVRESVAEAARTDPAPWMREAAREALAAM
jgi:HEAT repeat protein